MLVYGDKLLNVSYSGTCITIEATTEYQRFRKVNLEKFDEAAHFGMGEYNVVRVMTIHTSKGLEFDTVFVPGLVEGQSEHIHSFFTIYAFLLLHVLVHLESTKMKPL